MSPTALIAFFIDLFRAGYEIKQIVDTPNPETEEEYRKRLEELMKVPTVEELRAKYGKDQTS